MRDAILDLSTYLKSSCLVLSVFVLAGLGPAHAGSDSSMVDTASQSAGAFAVSGAVNAAKGATYSGMCSSNRYYYCYLALLAFQQAMSNSDGRSASYDTQERFSLPGWNSDVESTYQEAVADIKPPQGKAFNAKAAAVSEVIRGLEKKGYSFDKKTNVLTKPDGSTVSLAKAGVENGGLAGLGVDQATIDKVKNIEAKGKKHLNNMVVAMKAASFGGGFANTKSGGGSDSAYQDSLNQIQGLFAHRKRKPASVAGMKKVVGGEVIGVKMDNIFDMVHRRYQAFRKSKEFIE